MLLVNEYLAIKKKETYGESGREKVNDINIGGKKERENKEDRRCNNFIAIY